MAVDERGHPDPRGRWPAVQLHPVPEPGPGPGVRAPGGVPARPVLLGAFGHVHGERDHDEHAADGVAEVQPGPDPVVEPDQHVQVQVPAGEQGRDQPELVGQQDPGGGGDQAHEHLGALAQHDEAQRGQRQDAVDGRARRGELRDDRLLSGPEDDERVAQGAGDAADPEQVQEAGGEAHLEPAGRADEQVEADHAPDRRAYPFHICAFEVAIDYSRYA